jgi:hypothetical protein
MIEYNEALSRVLLYLQKREKIRPYNEYHKKKNGLPDYLDIWEIDTEILDANDKIRSIRLQIIFFPDFPLTFPKLLIAKEDFETIKYLPHLQVDRQICVFQNNSEPNVLSPEKVVEEAIRRAKNIIEDGLKGNNREDYEEEFEAYWNSNYSKTDVVNNSFLLLTEKPLEQIFSLITLGGPINKFKYVIHQNENLALNFKTYLKSQKIQYTETTGYLIPDLEVFITPPFNRSNKEIFDAIEKLEDEESKKYVSFIDNDKESKLFLFPKEIGSEIKYFGWFHSHAKLDIKGFRPNSFKNYTALSLFQSRDEINRILPHVYNSRRLIKRSAGEKVESSNKKFVLAGLGSIGSNLIHYLNSTQTVEFKLIDSDLLELENIGRHYLGFNYVNWKKTEALKDFLTKSSPIQKVETREQSVIQIIKDEPLFINESDFLFVAIGETNIEFWIAEAIKNGLINRPTFFLWVEPYLLGGHCIYINPENNNYFNYFNEDGLYKFNIIGDYKNELLSLKEAGCQSNYTPYSSNNIQLFLGNIYLNISEIINSKNMKSRSFSWVGDLRIASEMNIALSEYSMKFKANSLIENKI